MMRATLLLLLLALLAPPANAARPKGWWDRNWTCRKRIVLREKQRWADAPSARVRFGTGGRARDDGADIRVLTADRREIPRKVVGRGPGDLVEIVFPIGREREWFVYHGNPNAAPPEKTFAPDRGLYLTTRARGAGNPASWPAMEQILAKSKSVFGGASWKRVYDAENPFGPSDNYVSDYTGFLYAPKDGRYTFYTASDEASFLFVAGKLVAQWPGWHGAGRGAWGHFKGQIDLKKGLHAFRYVHVERSGAQIMAAYWLVPGAKKATVIPESYFPGHRETDILYHEVRDQGVAADFTSIPEDKWGLDGIVFEGVVFRARATGKKPTIRWDFGDGVTAQGAAVYHVYLKGGLYDVRLTVREGAEEDSVIRTIRVRSEWTRFDRNRDKTLKRMAETAAGYETEGIDPPVLERLIFLLDQGERDADAMRLIRTALRSSSRFSKIEEYRLALDLGRRYVEGPGNLPAAEWAFRKAIAAADRKQVAAARIGLADALLRLGGDPKMAEKLLEDLVRPGVKASKTLKLRAWLRLGDARMIAGNGAGARVAYEKAEEYAGGAEDVKRLLRKAAATRAAMTRIEAGQPRQAMRHLAAWELDAPTDRYTGLHRITTAKALVGLNRPAHAIRELSALVLSNPESEYADQALFLMAGIEEKRGNSKKAAALRERLKSEYPWSPLGE